jgi:hypothetical protein
MIIVWLTDSIPTHLVNNNLLMDTSGEVGFSLDKGVMYMNVKKFKSKPYKILKLTIAPDIPNEGLSKEDWVKKIMKSAKFSDTEVDINNLINSGE